MKKLALVSFLFLAAFAFLPVSKVKVIPVQGAIGEDIQPQDIIDLLDSAEQDSSVVGVVLRINSPGGRAVASHQIVRAVQNFSKPIVAYVEDSASSSAYWLAASCDAIIADELSVVGSVGAISQFIQISGLLERYGIEAETIAYPKEKGFGSMFQNMSLEEKRHAENLVKSASVFFRSDMISLRPQAEEYFDGFPYLAKDAPELVDEFGGFRKAVGKVKELAGVKKVLVEEESPHKGLRALLHELSALTKIGLGLKADYVLKFL